MAETAHFAADCQSGFHTCNNNNDIQYSSAGTITGALPSFLKANSQWKNRDHDFTKEGDECTIELKCVNHPKFQSFERKQRQFHHQKGFFQRTTLCHRELALMHKLNMTKQHFSHRVGKQGMALENPLSSLLSSNIVHLHESISKDCLVECFISGRAQPVLHCCIGFKSDWQAVRDRSSHRLGIQSSTALNWKSRDA